MAEVDTIYRMRVFAGPNGSGKSGLVDEFKKHYPTGPLINADEILKSCNSRSFINLGEYGLQSTEEHFNNFLENTGFVTKAKSQNFTIDVSLSDNVLRVGSNTNPYEAAMIAEYLRALLVEKPASFSFETVMSHESKIEMLKTARAAGFKNYLYFVSTEGPELNKLRVELRVAKGGHSVPPATIESRYYKSMDLLYAAIPYCHRVFIFDNSSTKTIYVAQLSGDGILDVNPFITVPEWVERYFLSKLGV